MLLQERWGSAPYGIAVISSRSHHIMFANINFKKKLSYSIWSLRRRPVIDFIYADDIDKSLAALGRVMSGSSVRSFKNRLIDANGKEVECTWDFDRVGDVYWGRCYFVSD